ncbi:MAG: DUF3800 domain-containing protein [Candidatus Bathyarchaeum tardum]|nr:MAG: DUF3800 domain-containing protein [Candidatus Bathyarchaeum tardum]
MYLAYLDESGRPTKDTSQEKYFVLATLIINEQKWQYIDNKVNEIKTKHFPDLPPQKIELHAKDMLNRNGIFNGLNWDKIYGIFEDIFEFLADNETEVCTIAVVINKAKMYHGKDIEKWAYRLTVERINKFLEKNNGESISRGEPPQFGIMIIDSCGFKPDERLREKVSEMLDNGTHYSDLKYLIENPLFTNSKWRNLSQLVDCVAYAVRKKFRNSSSPSFHDENWFKYYDKIFCKFDKNEDGKVEGCGIKVFPL